MHWGHLDNRIIDIVWGWYTIQPFTCENYKFPINPSAVPQSQANRQKKEERMEGQCLGSSCGEKEAARRSGSHLVLSLHQGFTQNPPSSALLVQLKVQCIGLYWSRNGRERGRGQVWTGKRNDFQGRRRRKKTEGSAGEIVKGSRSAITIYFKAETFNWRAPFIFLGRVWNQLGLQSD